MATDIIKEHAHKLIDRLKPEQVDSVVGLLEVMVRAEADDELSKADRQAIAASREYFQQGGTGLSFEQIAAESGFTMDQIRSK